MDAFFGALYSFMDAILPQAMEPTYMKRALLAVLIIPPLTAAIGVPLLQFRMAYFSEAIGHAAFTGVALGVLAAALLRSSAGMTGALPTLGIFAFCLFIAYGITLVRGRSELSRDTIVGVFASASVALGIAIMSAMKQQAKVHVFLFGDVLTISERELVGMAALAAVVALYLCLTFNRLMLAGIEEGFARTKGVSVRFMEVSYALAVALVIAAAIPIIGMMLVTAMLIIPAAVGRNVAIGAWVSFWTSVFVGSLCGLLGLFAALRFDIPVGAAIVLIAAICFGISLPARALILRRRFH